MLCHIISINHEPTATLESRLYKVISDHALSYPRQQYLDHWIVALSLQVTNYFDRSDYTETPGLIARSHATQYGSH